MSSNEPFLTAPSLWQRVPFRIPISLRTIQRVLNKYHIHARRPAFKILLSPFQRLIRVKWAKMYSHMSDLFWKRCIFSDESQFDISEFKPHFVRRPNGQRLNEKYIHGKPNRSTAKCMVWGAFSYHGYTDLVRINGNLKSQGYCNIINNRLIPKLNTLLPFGGFFQQDNAPIHVSRATNLFFLQMLLLH